ncbi:hypothetical protein ACH41H_01545 [Streptomyces sp. NPDC020800]|uniref:hypothetical protein n=1 Tax=Streptomyces sp. NPDC020800 TaxID=3365092 RepID=UPI0037AEFA3E
MADVPENLVELERVAEQERARLAGLTGEEYEAQRRRWRTASEAVRAAIDSHAAETGIGRCELEQSVKQAVRYTEEDPAQ